MAGRSEYDMSGIGEEKGGFSSIVDPKEDDIKKFEEFINLIDPDKQGKIDLSKFRKWQMHVLVRLYPSFVQKSKDDDFGERFRKRFEELNRSGEESSLSLGDTTVISGRLHGRARKPGSE